MSRIRLYNARLVDPASGLDGPGGVEIEDGVIVASGPDLAAAPAGAEGFDCRGRVLAPGLIDLRVRTGEPGAEHKETLASASEAAAAGGVTTFVAMPATQPVIDDIALVDFIRRRAEATAKVRVIPACAVTKGLAGAELAELGLLKAAGAAFATDCEHPVADAALLRRAMQYARGHGLMIASRPDEARLTAGGVVHAGPDAARKGLKGLPAEAETIGLQRDLALAEATGAALLVDMISTARSLEILRAARARGQRVSVSVAAANIFFNALDVGPYLTYCKVNPPFRPEADRAALVEAIAAGEIDAVVSAHDPQPPEDKRLPLGEAAFGAIALETLLATLLSLVHQEEATLLQALRPVTCGPADLLGLPQGRLAPGAPADVILFDPGAPWACDREHLRSRSKNSPWDGRRLQGRVLKTWVGGRCVHDALTEARP